MSIYTNIIKRKYLFVLHRLRNYGKKFFHQWNPTLLMMILIIEKKETVWKFKIPPQQRVARSASYEINSTNWKLLQIAFQLMRFQGRGGLNLLKDHTWQTDETGRWIQKEFFSSIFRSEWNSAVFIKNRNSSRQFQM